LGKVYAYVEGPDARLEAEWDYDEAIEELAFAHLRFMVALRRYQAALNGTPALPEPPIADRLDFGIALYGEGVPRPFVAKGRR
jgi:hypothetical protein